jgi:hypothetical protein
VIFKVQHILNPFLRSISMGSKFALIFVLSAYDSELYGRLAYEQSLIIYCTYLIGLDFFVISNRRILEDPTVLSYELRQRWKTYIICALLVIPVSYFLFSSLVIAGIFGGVVFFELISQELFRLLVIKDRQLVASSLLFLRTGSWPLAGVAMYLINGDISITSLLSLWLFFSFISCFFGVIALEIKRQVVTFGLPDRIWFRDTFELSKYYFTATVLNRSVFFADKFLIQLSQAEKLASYALYSSAILAVFALIEAMFLTFLVPHAHREREFSGDSMRITMYYIVGSLFIFVLAMFPLYYIIFETAIFDAELQNDLDSFVILSFAYGTYLIYSCLQVELYLDKQDKVINYFKYVSVALFYSVVLGLSNFGSDTFRHIAIAFLSMYSFLLISTVICMKNQAYKK